MILTDPQLIKEMATQAADPSQYLILDTETSGLMPYHGDVLVGTVIFLPDADESYYIPWRHRQGENAPIECMEYLYPVFENPKKHIMGWNLKHDIEFLENEPSHPEVKTKFADVMLGFHLIDENQFDYGLKGIARRVFGSEAGKAEDDLTALLLSLFPEFNSNAKMRKRVKCKIIELDPLTPELQAYVEADTRLPWDIYRKRVWPKLKAEGLLGIFNELSDYLRVTIDMEKEGMFTDWEAALDDIPKVGTWMETKRLEIESLTNGQIKNPISAPQCQRYFGRPSVTSDWLKEQGSDTAQEISEYRAGSKIVGSFYQPMVSLRDATGRLHPNIKLHGTISGRPSCGANSEEGGGSLLNLQAIAKEGDTFKIRSKIISDRDHVLASFDLSQAEIRLLAHYTRDPYLIQVFLDDKDLHQEVADIIGCSREHAKRLNLGIVYGLGVPGFSAKAKISKARALEIVTIYNLSMPTVSELRSAMQRQAESKKYITMWTGRRRHFVHPGDMRKAMSNLIQGGVAEIMRHTLCKLHSAYKDRFPQEYSQTPKIILQVHDEIVVHCPLHLVNSVVPLTKNIIQDHNFRVPIKCEAKTGYSWGEMTKWEG